MNTVCEKEMCTGCMACIDICPKKAIKIVDSLIAYNAIIDSNKCIKCDACYKICQNNNKPILNKPIFWKQGWACDDEIRSNSSSGGIASAIEQAFIKDGGIVCSCVFKSGEFIFEFAENEKEIDKFAGSKYVKSNPKGIYKEVYNKLKENKKVLFVGLPCQVSAIRNYTRNHINLYTIDLICHGTPSPKILECFLNDYGVKLTGIEEIKFRTKNNFRIKQGEQQFSVPTIADNYSITFLNSTSYTENCYQCNYAQIDRVGDITLGDSWGSKLEKCFQDKGISLVLCQNAKGKELIDMSDLHLIDVDLDNAIENNHQLKTPSRKPKQRAKFFRELKKGYKFKDVFRKCYPKTYLKTVIKTAAYDIKMTRE